METRRNKQIFCFPTFLWVDVYFQLKTTERESEEKTESWMRGQQTCSLTIHFNMWTVSSDVSIQRRHWQPLSVHLWAYCTHPTHDVNDVMSEGWPQHRGLHHLLFSNSGVGNLRPIEPDKCKCCERGPTVFRPYPKSETIWRVFVYMREEFTLRGIFLSSTPIYGHRLVVFLHEYAWWPPWNHKIENDFM